MVGYFFMNASIISPDSGAAPDMNDLSDEISYLAAVFEWRRTMMIGGTTHPNVTLN
jgi:hypothetical protein